MVASSHNGIIISININFTTTVGNHMNKHGFSQTWIEKMNPREHIFYSFTYMKFTYIFINYI